MHVPKASKRCESGEGSDHAVERGMESHDVLSRRRREDSRLVKDIGSVGHQSEGREGAVDDDSGRDRRELREPQGEGGVVHDRQDRAKREEDRKRYRYRWRWTT